MDKAITYIHASLFENKEIHHVIENTLSLRKLTIVFILMALFCDNSSCLAFKPVTIKKAFQVMSPHGPLNVVQVQYNFPGHNYVIASSHGLIRAQGTLRFLTKSNKIEFRDPDSNTLLSTVTFDEKIKLMGRKAAPIPLAEDFPSAASSGKWSKSLPFGDNLIKVLNQHFPNGYLPLLKEDERVFITNYRTLKQANRKEKVRVAAMIKIPLSTKLGRPVSFRVHYLAQERRSHSDWRRAQTDSVLEDIQKFIHQLSLELAGSGSG